MITAKKKEKILNEVNRFFAASHDFNGISLTELAKNVRVGYQKLLPIVRDLVINDQLVIQGGDNPHIRRIDFPKETQLAFLKEAKNNKVKVIRTIKPKGFSVPIAPIRLVSQSHLLCVYPSKSFLMTRLDSHTYEGSPYTKRLAFGEAQLTPVFCEIDVLERYFGDPRYRFEFEDYCGSISIVDNETNPTILKKHDQVFLKTFGLGYDETRNRVAVVYLRYLSDLTPEHQIYWRTKQVDSPCKIVAEYYQNTFLGEWTASQSLFSAVLEEQKMIHELSIIVTGKPLFRETFEGDKRPMEFTFFMSPTLVNYERFVSLLDKMLSDNLNKDFFKGEIEEFEQISLPDGIVERRPKGTLRLLEEWLKKNKTFRDEETYSTLMRPLKDVRKQRQKPAHVISENTYDRRLYDKQMELVGRVYNTLMNLRMLFHHHHRVFGYKIPAWIQNRDIKNF